MFPPATMHFWSGVLAWPQAAGTPAIHWLTDPTTQWPEAAWEFQTCSSHFINHQNFGYETCCSWNNFTCGVHFVLIINFSFQSLSLYSHQKTSQASSPGMEISIEACWLNQPLCFIMVPDRMAWCDLPQCTPRWLAVVVRRGCKDFWKAGFLLILYFLKHQISHEFCRKFSFYMTSSSTRQTYVLVHTYSDAALN